MRKDKYCAYSSDAGELETFQTFDEAKEWIIERAIDDNEFSDDVCNGCDYIAKITHRTKYVETDNIKNYNQEQIDDGEWWWSFDSLGEITMEKIK